ncbi:hypothetical protein Ciccas_007379 [Cichlidogyrus casuarinus]|uniref:Dynein regulatory complex protein 1/2 N-terminal domain-containing protein n=1 Tax=Cichlidogyrus casuarinus TaxID=1844966 RepID=A0ABD2Q332_9PLAT
MLTPAQKKIYLRTKEDEDTGPKVDSNDMEERIAARRIRIQKRVENRNRPAEVNTESQEIFKPLSYKQIEFSYSKLQKLLQDGNEFVTNIRIATDARESFRRADEEELIKMRVDKLETEAETAIEAFQNIARKWEKSKKVEVPHELQLLLNDQLKACAELVETKSTLIKELQLELKSKDDQYVKELKRRAEDVDLLVERIEAQFQLMKTSFSSEINEIEQAFVTQRAKLLEEQTNEWHQLLSEIKRKQTQFLEDRNAKVEEIQDTLAQLRITHAEDYKVLKCKLENDVQTLEQQLEIMKANFQLNLEKLEYNFQVLKRRDEENLVTKAKQKRKITKILDALNLIRRKAKQVEITCRTDNEQLVEEMKSKMKALHKMTTKMRTLMDSDSKNYHDVWVFNEIKCQTLSKQLLEADRIITEQQLGLIWNDPQ